MQHKNIEKAKKILQKLNDKGYEAYFVGGCVRNHLLGHKIEDIDISTNAPIEVIKNLGGVDISKNMNLDVFSIYGIEVSQFRSNEVSFIKDCQHRDFTINALAIDIHENIIDYVHGKEDLQQKMVKCVGKADDRFEEDYLRMLRAVRFASLYDFCIEGSTVDSIQKNASKILTITPERIFKEIQKACNGNSNKFRRFIELLDSVCLLQYVFPEIKRLQGLQQKEEHHPEGDAYKHTLCALEKSPMQYDTFAYLSILFHDCGKYSSYDKENLTFYGHEKKGTSIIEEFASRLKIPNKLQDCMSFVAEKHMNMHRLQELRKTKAFAIVTNPYFDILFNTHKADCLSRFCIDFEKDDKEFKKKKEIEDLITYIETLKSFISSKASNTIALDVNGRDVLKFVPEGKEVGRILDTLRELVINGNIENERNTLLATIKEIINE